MTDENLLGNASIFILAGSETSATLLSGLMYLLLKNPDSMRKVRDEIDAAFNDPSEMTFVKEAQLPYLHACIEETFRIYPPIPMELNRTTPPEGATIDGIFVPGNVSGSYVLPLLTLKVTERNRKPSQPPPSVPTTPHATSKTLSNSTPSASSVTKTTLAMI